VSRILVTAKSRRNVRTVENTLQKGNMKRVITEELVKEKQLKSRHAEKRNVKKKEGKAMPVTGHEGPYGCKTSRLTHFL
jgi:hypothetical protein